MTKHREGLPDLPNSEIVRLVDEWIYSEVDRHVLKRYLIDGISIERIAEEVDRSPRQTARIIKGGKLQLNNVLK